MDKSKLKKGLMAVSFIMMLASILLSCAQQKTSISGGDKDTIPPTMRKSSPTMMSGDFDGNKVKIRFDEYFTLEKIEQTFLMTPPHDSIKPKIRVKGKYVVVKFKEPLKPDTTYTLQFFSSIKDFNEGNQIPNYQFVFSTGHEIDTFAVSGHVYDAQTLEKEKDMLVCLYGEGAGLQDSAFLKNKPDYITRTDTAGYFHIPNIKKGRYKIYALADINETQRFDLENEKVAFLKTEIVPEAQRMLKIDSLWAGMILHKGAKGHRYLDTLLCDTVIVQDINYTTPNNINLYTFEEKHLIQYISERNRDLRQRVKLVFNKTVGTDTVLVTYVDDTLRSPEMVYDFNYGRDSLIIWLKDTADINNDTLQLRVTFSTLDSLNNPTTETDTLQVKFAKKKAAAKDDKNAKAPAETGIDSLDFKIKTTLSGDLDIGKSIKVQIPIMLERTDTSLMKIYELVDSTFEEDMNQKLLKNMRLDSAEYRLIFKRPLLGDIVWYPTDSIVSKDWYKATYSANRDTVDITVLDSAMIKKSKFKNMLKYHNSYYLGQVQKIRDTINTVIINQKMLKYERPCRDTIYIHYEKVPKRGVVVEPINIDKLPEGGIEIIQDKEKITLLLKDSSAIMKDTLALKVNTFDRYIHNRAHKVVERTLKDTIFAMHKIKYQRIKKQELRGTDTMVFVFEQKLKSDPILNLVGMPQKGSNWYQSYTSAKADTFMVVSGDPDFQKLDSIRFSISYHTLTSRETDTLRCDTLMMVRPVEKKQQETSDAGGRRRKSDVGKQQQQQKQQQKQQMAKALLMFPMEYTIETDSMNHKNLILNFAGEPGKQYMLEVDDSTFTSIYGTPNLYLSSKTKVRTEDFYGTFTLNLRNVGNLERYADIDENLPPFQEIDTSHTLRRRINPNDTLDAEFTHVREGQLMVCMCDAKGNIKYMQTVKTDSTMQFKYIVPGEYFIRIIHDRNENGNWDTGKFLEQSYPERTLKYPKKQVIKTNWNTEADWRL